MYISGMSQTSTKTSDYSSQPPLRNLQSIRRLVISRHPAIHQKTPPFVVTENATLHVFGPLSQRHTIPIASRYPLDKVRRFTIWNSFRVPSDGIPTHVWNDFFQQMPSLCSWHIIFYYRPCTFVSALLPPHEKNNDKEKVSEMTTTTKSDDTQPHPGATPSYTQSKATRNSQLSSVGALAHDRSNQNTSLRRLKLPRQNSLVVPHHSSDTDSEDKNGVFTTEDVYFLKKHVRDVIFTQKTQQGEMVLIPPELGGRLFKWIRTLYASLMTPS